MCNMSKHAEPWAHRLLLVEHILNEYIVVFWDTAGDGRVMETVTEVKYKVGGFNVVAHDSFLKFKFGARASKSWKISRKYSFYY